MERASKPDSNRQEFEFIVILRPIAALMVVYFHLIGGWANDHADPGWALVAFIRNYVTKPLGIMQEFGALGVSIFFLISGFIITYTAQRETHLAFGIKRLLRIYPPYILAVFITYLVSRALLGTPYYVPSGLPGGITLERTLAGTTLLNYILKDRFEIVPVGWTLLIELIFYGLCAVTLTLVQRRPRLTVLINMLFCLAFIEHRRHTLNVNLFWFTGFVAYVPTLIFGQIIYYFWSRRMGWRSFGILASLCYILIIHGFRVIQTDSYTVPTSYPISIAYAMGIFSVFLLVNDQLRVPRVIRFLSKISFSIYLYHLLVGATLMVLLIPIMGYGLSLVVGLTAVLLVSYLSWRFVEKPSQQLARLIIRRLQLTPSDPVRVDAPPLSEPVQ